MAPLAIRIPLYDVLEFSAFDHKVSAIFHFQSHSDNEFFHKLTMKESIIGMTRLLKTERR